MRTPIASFFFTMTILTAFTLAHPEGTATGGVVSQDTRESNRKQSRVKSTSVAEVPADGKAETAEGSTADAIDVGSRKQLFIDGRFVESSHNIAFTMNPPRRDGQVRIAGRIGRPLLERPRGTACSSQLGKVPPLLGRNASRLHASVFMTEANNRNSLGGVGGARRTLASCVCRAEVKSTNCSWRSQDRQSVSSD